MLVNILLIHSCSLQKLLVNLNRMYLFTWNNAKIILSMSVCVLQTPENESKKKLIQKHYY